jgi:hypothetical protein
MSTRMGRESSQLLLEAEADVNGASLREPVRRPLPGASGILQARTGPPGPAPEEG